MFKKLCLSAAFITLSFTLSGETDHITTIQKTLTHIAHEKNAIRFEMKTALLLQKKAETHFRELLQENYQSAKEQCLALLSTILASTEFTTTIEQVTNDQTTLITVNNACFNDLIVDPTAFPLEQKLKDELSLVSFDDHHKQLFNVLYTVFTIIRGSKILLEKLAVKENELMSQLASLQAANQTVN